MSETPLVLRVAVPSPLHTLFDYLPAPDTDPGTYRPGVRLRVPFGRGRRVGVLVARVEGAQVDPSRLRAVEAVLDDAPLLDEPLLELGRWAAAYYLAPPGEVLAQLLPPSLRDGAAQSGRDRAFYRLSDEGRGVAGVPGARALRQQAVWQVLARADAALSQDQLLTRLEGFDAPALRNALRALMARGWVSRCEAPVSGVSGVKDVGGGYATGPELNPAQSEAVEALVSALGVYAPFLLEGVTGSGKTEVYLRAIAGTLGAGRQALVLVPEIALTPQLVARFEARFGARVVLLHSGMADGARLESWRRAREGRASVVIGTRSAVFAPLAAPGLIVVDEEHDPSYKQQEGFRYHARDVAIWRARQLGIPVVLGSATPSLETLRRVGQGSYRRLALPRRATGASLPRIEVLDIRRRPMKGGLSDVLVERARAHLLAGGQVLFFLNRRGYAPALLCHACGWAASCTACDAHMTVHRALRRLRCHHCGAERPLPARCPACGGELMHAGEGTEQIEDALRGLFPEFTIERIDRDTTRRRGALEERLESVRSGRAHILVGTQMLAKGHDFPDMSLVGVIDADQGLFSSDFRASERLAQLLVQVAGRAGRGARPGEVLIQTHCPEHPLLHTLVTQGYDAFARQLLTERERAGLPPYGALALLRAEAKDGALAEALLNEAAHAAAAAPGVSVLGPVPAPMARRAGRERRQLLLQAAERAPLRQALRHALAVIEASPDARRVRWSVDVDPVEMF